MALVVSVPVCAQTTDEDDLNGPETESYNNGKNGLRLGPVIGFDFSSASDTKEGKFGDGAGFGMGYAIAAVMRFGRATENSRGGTGSWAVGIELRYTKKNAQTTASDNLSLGYFELPVYVHYHPFIKSRNWNGLYLEAGGSLGSMLSVSPEKLTISNPSPSLSDVTYYLDTNKSKLKGGDFHPFIGMGYMLTKAPLGINLRYNIGTTNLANNFTTKISTFEIGFTYLFNICRF